MVGTLGMVFKPMTVNFELFQTPFLGAEFSPCRKWRYSLWRIWVPTRKRVAFIGLNPSTADETTNDPTVARCINYAKRWGYGGMWMLNIFGWRATDPRDMKAATEPVGRENDGYILDITKSADLVVCAWGNHGEHMGRGEEVKRLLSGVELNCLGTTKGGHPKHPLYLRGDLKPIPFEN